MSDEEGSATTTPEERAVPGGSGADTAASAAGEALFRLGRVFGRKPPQHLIPGEAGRAVELSRLLVAQAVGAGPEEPDREVTVGVVAERLGVDPSTASRLVAETVQDGYLARAASQADGRRAQLALTDTGRTLVEDARRYQRAVFEHATRDWSRRERDEFARLFVKFAEAVMIAVADARGEPS